MGRKENKTLDKYTKSKSKIDISSHSDKTIQLKKKRGIPVPIFIKKSIENFSEKEEKQSYLTFGTYLFRILSNSQFIDEIKLEKILEFIRENNYPMFVSILLNLDKIDFFNDTFLKLHTNKKLQYYINSVRPTQFQTDLILKKDLSQQEFISDYKEALFSSRSDIEIKDLEERCKKLVDMCFSQNKFHIVFLDGHGRTLYFLLDFIRKRYKEEKIEKQFTLEIVEIDETIHEFHHKFFPKSDDIIKIKCIHDDIFQRVENKDAIYYFNFCGLKEVVDTVLNLTAFHKIKYFMEKNKNKNMLSFSILHHKNIEEYKYFKSHTECFSDDRGDFKTFII